MLINVTKVAITGKQWIHQFQDAQKKVVRENCLSMEYYALKNKGAINPVKQGCVWMYSYETLKFDTQSTFLEDNQYAIDPDHLEVCYIKLKNRNRIVQISTALIVNNTVEDSLVPDS